MNAAEVMVGGRYRLAIGGSRLTGTEQLQAGQIIEITRKGPAPDDFYGDVVGAEPADWSINPAWLERLSDSALGELQEVDRRGDQLCAIAFDWARMCQQVFEGTSGEMKLEVLP
jgi:hypothetical protein